MSYVRLGVLSQSVVKVNPKGGFLSSGFVADVVAETHITISNPELFGKKVNCG